MKKQVGFKNTERKNDSLNLKFPNEHKKISFRIIERKPNIVKVNLKDDA